MKRPFDICIFLSDIKHVLHLEETLRIMRKPGDEISEILDLNLKVNQHALTVLIDYMYKIHGLNFIDHISRIYYGQETCENLIPTEEEVIKALEYCNEKEIDFTFVTPYVAPQGIEKLKKILSVLETREEEIEVVVNDFGVLQLIITEFTSLKPVMGRLLTKFKRDPRFSISGYDIATRELKNPAKVEKNQKMALQSAGIDLPEYRKFLKEKNIENVGFDSIPQGFDPKLLKKWGFRFDIYWPWTYITSGRNCAIAAYTQPGKQFHPTDEPCSFQCRTYEFTFTSDKRMFSTVQRGNAVWMNSESLYEDFFAAGFDRLVFEPYIPL